MWKIRNAQRAMESDWNIHEQTSNVDNHDLHNHKATPQFAVMILCLYDTVAHAASPIGYAWLIRLLCRWYDLGHWPSSTRTRSKKYPCFPIKIGEIELQIPLFSAMSARKIMFRFHIGFLEGDNRPSLEEQARRSGIVATRQTRSGWFSRKYQNMFPLHRPGG